jgi:hypothetical protein
MKKLVFLFVLILIMTLVFIGCSKNSIKEPPEISITIKDKEIYYITAKNKWNGNIYDREDTFITILKEQKDIPTFEIGNIVKIIFKSNPPDEFKILDILIDENGRQIYTDKEIKNIPAVLYDGKYTFEIEHHLASALSSQYEPEKKDIRGFRMIASWGENECEYAFVIKTYTKTDVNQNEPQPIGNDIDRSEYITGEIITDGDYTIIERIGSNFITFIPDKESLEIIKAKYGEKKQYQLIYDDIKKIHDLPDKLGIYKVKVKINQMDNYGYLVFDEIMLTDKIGTILYEGKSYENNDLDDKVEIKDRVSGLIVNHVVKSNGGVVVGFAGEIESEGYYFIDPNEASMYGPTGFIYPNEEFMDNFPTIYGERTIDSVWFSKTNELYDELKNNSLFGKGKFKTSGYFLVYNYGMGWGPGAVLNEIISLDEAYKNLFSAEDGKAIGNSGITDDFVIVNHTLYDEVSKLKEREYYYINNKNLEKIVIPVEHNYYYHLMEVLNDNEFILQTEGYDEGADQNNESNPHEIKCTITPEGILTEKIN